MIESTTFEADGTTLAGTFYLPADGGDLVPAVVSASGFGGVKEMLLPTFAAALASKGIASLLFDYAGFGASGGEPRQYPNPLAQVAQFGPALDHLAAHRRVDPGRLGVWGPSLAGGHALRVAATEPYIQAAVAIVPYVGGDAIEPVEGLIEAVIADAEAQARGEVPAMVAAVGRPGDLAVMNTDGAWEWSERMTADAPNFRNEVALASLLDVLDYRPADLADQIRVPLRVILATDDSITPAAAARVALARVAHLDVIEFPDSHFELFDEHLAAVVDATVEWFSKHL